MIDKQTAQRIRQLLREGELSQRTIAKNFGVSRSVVRLLATRPEEKPKKEDEIVYPHGKPRRCSLCGALVQMPCLACQIRNRQNSKPSEVS